MKTPRLRCRRCNVGLNPVETTRPMGLCLRCARQEQQRIRRYFLIGAIVGLCLALVVFGLLGLNARNAARGLFRDYGPEYPLARLAAASPALRAPYVAVALIIPFGYFPGFRVKAPTPQQEHLRQNAMTEFSNNTQGLGSEVMLADSSESTGMGLMVIAIILSPVTAPFCIVYQILRAITLRSHIARLTAEITPTRWDGSGEF